MILPLILPINAIQTSATDTRLYVGTYTIGQASKGIYQVHLNTDTGALSEPYLAAEAVNPSYLATDSAGRFLYVAKETADGEVSAFSIETSGNLKLLDRQPSQGGSPCYLCVAPGDKSVLVANYGGGNIASFPVVKDGSIGPADREFQNTGLGVNAGRQESPHMHSISVDPSSRFTFACDLGTDEILIFPFDKRSGEPHLNHPRRVQTRPGSGPRHAVLDSKGKFLYLVNELSNSVSVFCIGARTGPMVEIQNISTLPPDMPPHKTAAAEIALHPNGKWLYVSNRGYDSIACFEIGAGGRLKPVEISRLDLHEPRGFAIDPTGKWLVVGGQHSNNLAAIGIDPTTGALTHAKSIVHLPAPVCVLFAKGR